jgi:hypothetical protein
MLADAADDMAEDLGDLYSRGPLAGAQQGEHRLAASAVENADRLEAGAIVVRIEERQFLLAVGGIIGVVNIEHDAGGRSRKAPGIKIDPAEADTPSGAQVGQVLEPRQGRLAHQVVAAFRCPADRDFQGGIALESIDVITILVAGRDHQHPRCHDK